MGKLTEVYIIEKKSKPSDAKLKDIAKMFTKEVVEALNNIIDRSVYWENKGGSEYIELTDKEVIDMVKTAVKNLKWSKIRY